MRKITILFLLFTSLLFAQSYTALSLPTTVTTNPDSGSATNTYDLSFDYDMTQSEFDAITFFSVRIRPTTSANGLGGTNYDFFILADFQSYVGANGLTGTYTNSLSMPTDSELASSANLVAPAVKYQTRIQTTGFQSTFTDITVLDSSGSLGIENIANTALEGVYYANGSITTNDLSGEYAIYNIAGSVVADGVVSSTIDVSALSSGIYILATDSGYLKFVK